MAILYCWCPKPAKLPKHNIYAGYTNVSVPLISACSSEMGQFVWRHRYNFKVPTSKYALLCSAHFEESSYERSLSILSSLEGQRIKMKSWLKKDAIPTRDSVRSNHAIFADALVTSLQQRNLGEPTKFSSEHCSYWHLKVQRHQKMKKWAHN